MAEPAASLRRRTAPCAGYWGNPGLLALRLLLPCRLACAQTRCQCSPERDWKGLQMHAPCKAWLPFRSQIMRQFAVAAQFGNPSRLRRLHPFRSAFSNFGVTVSPLRNPPTVSTQKTHQPGTKWTCPHVLSTEVTGNDNARPGHSFVPATLRRSRARSLCAQPQANSVRETFQQSTFLPECLCSYLKDFMHSIAIGDTSHQTQAIRHKQSKLRHIHKRGTGRGCRLKCQVHKPSVLRTDGSVFVPGTALPCCRPPQQPRSHLGGLQ